MLKIRLGNIICVLVIALITDWGGTATAQDEPADLPWKTLTFSASKWFNTVNTRIELSTEDTVKATAAAVESNQGQPLEATSSKLQRIRIHTIIDPAIGTTVELQKDFWLDSLKNNVLFGETLRTGQDEYLRRYRFTRQGVYRFRREPTSVREARLSPQSWSDKKASFYSYSPQIWDCKQILEPSALIYLFSKVNFNSSEPLPAYCVFHKRQLYRVTLQHGGTRLVDVDYQVISSQKVDDFKKQIQTARMMLKAAPLGDYRGEVEDFSFLGFKKDVELIFDPVTHRPVLISGQIPNLGHSVLRLKTVRLSR